MGYTATVLVLVIAYAVIAVLLLSMNLTSRWRWWIKGGAIIITTAFFAVSYLGVRSVLGWPSSDRLFERFEIVYITTVEPDPFLNTEGAVYMWVKELDEDNIPSNVPRVFALPWTEPLADAVEGVQEQINAGETVQGEFREPDPQGEDDPGGEDNPQLAGDQREGGASNFETMDFSLLSFEGGAPIVVPEKAVL